MEKKPISLDELLTKLHRNDPISPFMVTIIAKHASTLGESICADYHTLNAILVRHEATIQKHYFHILDEGTQDPKSVKEALIVQDKPFLPSEAKMWPFINLEDLSKPKCLLIFLNARGRNVPLAFAPTEELFCPLAAMSPCGTEPELEKYMLQFSSDPSSALYGKVRPRTKAWDEYVPDSNGYEHCPRVSLQTLHIQQRILRFLVTCSKLVLHDHTEDTLVRYPALDEPPYADLELRADVGHTTFADALVNAPYRSRRSIDLARLRGYFKASCEDAKDHIFALREDPSYFADVFLDLSDHSVEMTHNEKGQVHPDLGSTKFLMNIARQIVFEAYTMFAIWQELCGIVDKLTEAFHEGAGSNDRFISLMSELACRTQDFSKFLQHGLAISAVSAPNIRKFFVRGDDSATDKAVQFWSLKKANLDEFSMISWFMYFLKEPDDNLKGTATYHLLDKMATLMRTSKDAKALMSPRILKLFGRVFLIEECIMQCTVWYDIRQSYDFAKDVSHSHDEDFFRWAHHMQHCQLPVHTINPSRGKLAYPIHKPRNRSNVRTMRTAEANLDRFWDCVDTFYEEHTGVSQHGIIRQCILEGGQMQRTPPWEEPLATIPKPMEQPEYVYQPFSRIFHNKAMQITGAFDRLAIEEKTKPKTKGSTIIAVVDEAANPVPAASEDTFQQTFTLDKRAYRTMKALFHVALSDDEDFPKAIKWDEFKRAMVRIGFAAEKLQGSAWQFTPGESLDADRGIHFHEPHPDSDIPYIMARRFGRRLERVYGWRSEMFRLS
ncbi:uncharacterized protein J4E88_006562 [Alternaria novae-zelandiae]|uniref:uncharacterized protein n=1 Tax=Alternaria novae-zelandiae TaxID=430562 RepID=UPI0020C541B5|nr:uncharacterized protein J4E88_006562 [Alternaria novae-zelandiae]KAI4678044.1 hypothetical protein J4E88_006562 [Alternaria novae-zelandiae]